VRERDKIWRLSLLNQQRSGQSQQHFGTRRREREREPGYLLAAGANPLTANLLNFITLSLAWKREGMSELHEGILSRRGGLFRRTRRRDVRFFASAERLDGIYCAQTAVSERGRKNCVNFN